MADIDIMKVHSLGEKGAIEKLGAFADKLNQDYGIKSNWSGNVCELSGTGIKKGTVRVTDTEVHLKLTLGMLAKAMKSKIKSQVNSQFDKNLS